MSEWTIDTLKEHFEKLLEEKDIDLRNALNQIGDLEEKLENIKSDHVKREEFSELKDSQSQGRGMRIAAAGFMGIIITLISVALGLMYGNQLTRGDVSNQIDREAPWLEDKPAIEQNLNHLDKETVLLKTNLATHIVTDNLRLKIKK